MKILHTSDWHLGRSLYGRKRYEEFSAFLNWLVETIEEENIDTLLVAGDIFDTSTPSNRAQELYYRFLFGVSNSCCRHVVIVAGNHDSPSFLDAPKELLKVLNVHVVGAMTADPDDEVIVLYKEKQPEAIVCAIPYLRDRDIRTVEPGETIDDKNTKLLLGLKKHYIAVGEIAKSLQEEFKKKFKMKVPIIASGHLFATGGKTIDGDGVRELYVGSLSRVGSDSFPSSFDYVALGHLHVPQIVGGVEHIRYSGSPIAMGFGEAGQEKQVVILDFKKAKPEISDVQVPCFQPLIRIEGSLDDIHTKIELLKQEKSSAWLEIEYTGSEIIGNLPQMIDEVLLDSNMEIRRIKNKRVVERIISTFSDNETLDDLEVGDVFNRCLDAFDVPAEDREELTVSYNEIIRSLHEDDLNKE